MTVFWTENAVGQMREIQSYIEHHSQRFAEHLIERIAQRVAQLADFPRVGRKLPEFRHDHVRELIEHEYRVIYVIARRDIVVLAVFHGARALADA